jgi:hypothetical protein
LLATVDESVEVNVEVPTSYAQAEGLYRQGNRVRIVGQLDCRMERQAGPSVVTKLAELDGEWAQRRADLAEKPQELQQALRRYRVARMRFEESPRLYVLALAVEVMVGEPLALEDTYEQRRAWVREQRQLREERRTRVAADRQRRMAASRPEATERIDDLPTPARVEDGDHRAEDVKVIRPRRRVESALTTADAGVPDAVVSAEA